MWSKEVSSRQFQEDGRKEAAASYADQSKMLQGFLRLS
jgi:hypothetical protein